MCVGGSYVWRGQGETNCLEFPVPFFAYRQHHPCTKFVFLANGSFFIMELMYFLGRWEQYQLIYLTHNPEEEGVPAKRPRRMTCFVRNGHTIKEDITAIQKSLRRSCILDGSAYFCATPDEVRALDISS